ncbi:MAG: preprotein translocase subunit SecY [Ruminococcus sp.]|nr:preprotein translocase subunit SecY [Ruminococcus sp.]
MIETFRNAWRVPELRRKLLFTLFIIIIYRIGGAVPVPYLDTEAIKSWFSTNDATGNFFSYLNVLSGGNMGKATLLALSVGPYINAQIIIQLLSYALPPLERLTKEGPEGRKKLNKITKYTALGISVFQAWAYYRTLGSSSVNAIVYTSGWEKWFSEIVIIVCFTAGASLTIWLGDQISEKGIGNGISMLLFAGIIARGPSAVWNLIMLMKTGEAKYIVLVPIILITFLLMIAFIIFMNEAERRIPIQYAKRVVGRKQYGGQNTFIPIKVCMSGVLPIIFAMAFMSLPSTLEMFIGKPESDTGFYAGLLRWFGYTHPFYAILYFFLIIGFNYFYVSMQYNPVEIANNLRQQNGGVPGIRPGKPTSDYFKRILSKITLVGAVFLGIIAIFPIIFGAISGIQIAMGGTSILIVVSVALETVRTMESQMMMRHHKGFLE